MSTLYLTLMAVLFSGFGARDQVRIAARSLEQGPQLAVLLPVVAISIATAVFAAWAATLIAPLLLPPARQVLLALALLFAGGESLVLVPRYRPQETSPSLGVLAIIVLAHQLTDSARFLVFGIAVATNAELPAGIGGALGGVVLIAAAWGFPALFTHSRTRLLRRLAGAGLLLLAVYIGLRALGKI